MSDYGWRVHLADDLMMDGYRLVATRRIGDGRVEIITGFDNGQTLILSQSDAVDLPPLSAFPLLPRGVAEAIAATISPGPSRAEVDRIEEALAVERARVDRALDRLTPLANERQPT